MTQVAGIASTGSTDATAWKSRKVPGDPACKLACGGERARTVSEPCRDACAKGKAGAGCQQSCQEKEDKFSNQCLLGKCGLQPPNLAECTPVKGKPTATTGELAGLASKELHEDVDLMLANTQQDSTAILRITNQCDSLFALAVMHDAKALQKLSSLTTEVLFSYENGFMAEAVYDVTGFKRYKTLGTNPFSAPPGSEKRRSF